MAKKNYLNHHAFGNAEIDDLRKEFETVTGKDLRPFFQQWYLRGGHPSIEIRYDYNDTTKLLGVYIEQKQNAEVGLYKFPLKFKVTQGQQTKFFNFEISKRKESFFVQKFDESSNSFPNVIVDPEAVFIGEIKDNRPFFNHILTYNTAGSYVEKIRSLSALSGMQKQLDTARFTILSAINDPDEDIRLRALQWVDWSNADSYSKTKDILIYQTKNDASAAVRAEATKILGDKKDPLLLNYFIELTNDSSYSVAGNALEAVYKILPDEGFRLAAKLDKDVRGKLFEQVCHIYGQMGDQFSLNFFKENLMKFHKGNRVKLIEKYTLLLLKLNSSATINEAAELFKLRASSDISGQVRYAAMKALKDIVNHKTFASKQTSDQVQMQTLLDEATALNNALQQIMVAEQESDVVNMLKLNGLYTEIPQ